MTDRYNRQILLCRGEDCERHGSCAFFLAYEEAISRNENPSSVKNLCRQKKDENTYVEVCVSASILDPKNRNLMESRFSSKTIARIMHTRWYFVSEYRDVLLRETNGTPTPSWAPPSAEAKQLICWCDFNNFPLAKVCKKWGWLLYDVRTWLTRIPALEYIKHISVIKPIG